MVTRITNTMLQNTLLSNLSMNLNRMDKLQNQMSSGRKYGHISDDPSALIYGQAARNKLARLGHYQSTVESAQSWLTQAEAGIMELNKVVGAIYEELVSAGSVKTDSDKQNLAMVVKQLQDHYVDTLNTSYGDRFVFGGYNTPGDWAKDKAPLVKPFTIVNEPHPDGPAGRMVPQLLYNGFNISQFNNMPAQIFNIDFNNSDDPVAALTDALAAMNYGGTGDIDDFVADFGFDDADEAIAALQMKQFLLGDLIKFDVGPGIDMPVTQNGVDVVFFISKDADGNPVMRNTFDLLQEVYIAINGDPFDPITYPPKGTDELTKLISEVQGAQNHLLTRTAEIGGRQRRLELLEARYAQDNLNYEKMRSDAEDADMAEVIMYLKMAETVYQAALSAGARVIQPTLMDFLR